MAENKVDVVKLQEEMAKQATDLKNLAYSLLPKEAVAIAEQAKAAGANPYTVQIGDDFYVYRTLSRFEYKALTMDLAKQASSIMSQAEDPNSGKILIQMKTEEAIVKKGCLYPKLDDLEIKEIAAGIIETLHNSIMMSSGFGQEVIPVKL